MVLGIDHEGSAAEQLSVVGRDAELDTLDEVLATAAASLVMIGSPGVGRKTTLWESAVAAAPRHGLRVLAARSSASEAQLPFAALIGLCEGIASDALLELPAPQRCALEAALLRAEPPGGQVQSTAIALGLLGAIRSLAAQDPLLVAVDDVQWLDRPSADLLAYAARRLRDADVRFLLARRPAHGRPGEGACPAGATAPERGRVELRRHPPPAVRAVGADALSAAAAPRRRGHRGQPSVRSRGWAGSARGGDTDGGG